MVSFTSPFLRDYRTAGPPPGQIERVLAVGRAFLTVAGLVAIYLDPTEPARLQGVTYGVLGAYALYSLALLAYVDRAAGLTRRHARVIHGLDIVWTSVLTFVSEGPVSPFFLFFLFVLLAAAYRGGFRATIGTALISVAVFLAEIALAAAGPWSATWFAAYDFELNSTILRIAYLLMTGVLLGYLAEQDKQSRAELAAIADVTRQPRVSLGLGGSVAAIGRTLLTTFGAASVVVVIKDHEDRRMLLWRVDRPEGPAGAPRVRRHELTGADDAAWLFDDYGAAWHVVRDASGATAGWALPAGAAALRRLAVEWPAFAGSSGPGLRFAADGAVTSITAANMGLPGEWQGRIYLMDASPAASTGTLHFLEALAEHVAPALTNVFLLRRLRARAGAAERARVARELHDGVIQALYAIEMKLEAVRRTADRSPAFVDHELGELQQQLRREALALRELMQALRPIEIEGPDQLNDVVASLVERFRRDTGISARFVARGEPLRLPPNKAVEIVRIVQEALANVRKHAGARNVLVSLSAEPGQCRLVVEDDGRGFGFDGRLSAGELGQRRIGPAIIRERARIAGAELVLESAPGSGARVELTLAGEFEHE